MCNMRWDKRAVPMGVVRQSLGALLYPGQGVAFGMMRSMLHIIEWGRECHSMGKELVSASAFERAGL